jgi:DNA-directed RNA polymerase subunit E'/Rpb7
VQHIPGDMEYNPESMSFTSAVTTGRIKSESKVRLKVVGSSVQATTLCAIGSINEPFLGLLE